MNRFRRRDMLATGAAALALGLQGCGSTATEGTAEGIAMHPDLILINGRFTTLDRANPSPEAVAITGGKFSATGDAAEVLVSKGSDTKVVDLRGRRAIPGLIDSHLHIIRGGLNYNMELRWDGVRSLADAMRML